MTVPAPQAPRSDRARRRLRPWLWLAGTTLLSAAIIAVAWRLDRDRPQSTKPTGPSGPITELRPERLTEAERSGDTSMKGVQANMRLDAGAWVQVAGPDGRVKQQYTAAQINPLPDKRVAMRMPQAVLYGSNGRVVTMRSDAMTAAVPKGGIESGRLEGSVVIRIYAPQGGRPVDLANDAAEVVIEAPEAEFDMKNGDIRADRSVKITSEALTFVGEGLNLELDQDGRNILRMTVDRPLSPIRIERSASMLQERSKGLRPADADPRAAASAREAGEAKAGEAAAPSAGGQRAARGGNAARGSTALDGGSAAAGAANPRARVARPYLLTISDQVRVVSQEAARSIIMTGDRLRLLFTMDSTVSDGLVLGLPGEAHAMAAVAAPSGPRVAWPALMAIAAPLAPGADESITIHYTGRLVLEQAPTSAPALPSDKAVRMEMDGAPMRVEDTKSKAVVSGARLVYESELDRVRIEGSEAHLAALDSPDMGMRGGSLELDRRTGKGGVPGPGSIRLGDPEKRPVTVAWQNGAQFRLAPGTENAEGSFRGADFAGKVEVRSRDFAMDAGSLAVEAEPVGRRDVLRRLVASDGVHARDLGEREGSLRAQRIDMTLQPDEEGNSTPRQMVATGDVMASDRDQVLWASSLRSMFVAPGQGGARGARSGTDARAGTDAGAQATIPRADVSSVVAEGPVELLLKDSTRVWASRMEGDAINGTARLIGPNVLVVRNNEVIDQLAELQVQERPAKLSAVGAGRASHYAQPVLAVTRERMGRPSVPQVPVMQATWRDGVAFAQGVVNSRQGGPPRDLLLMQGGVRVRASRSPLEAEALDSDEVSIELLPGAPKGSDSPLGGVARMVARGNVRAETQEWPTEQRSGEPRMFRLNAGNATYDVVEARCFVDGPGTVLLNDPGKPKGSAESKPADAKTGGALDSSPFSPDGITKFTWTRSLGVRGLNQGQSVVSFDGDVQMQHLGRNGAGTGTLAADHLEATVQSRADRQAVPADGAPAIGAGAQLESVTGRGRVTVRTSEFDLEAGEFTLDEARQVARLAATPGRSVTIVKRGAPATRADEAVWDLRTGVITVTRVRGNAPR